MSWQTLNKEFGELRTILNSQPTPKTWQQLTSWIESNSTPEVPNTLFEYISNQTQHWTDSIRIANPEWLDKHSSNSPDLRIAISRLVHFNILLAGPSLSGKNTTKQRLTALWKNNEGAHNGGRQYWNTGLRVPKSSCQIHVSLDIHNPSNHDASRLNGISQKADAIIVVLDAQTTRREANLNVWMDVEDMLEANPKLATRLVLQCNKQDLPDTMIVEQMQQDLGTDIQPIPTSAIESEDTGIKQIANECLSSLIQPLQFPNCPDGP